MTTCVIDRCDRSIFNVSRSLCDRHYNRLLKYGSPEDSTRKSLPDLCVIEDCGHPRAVTSWCWSHYDRKRDFGDPLAGPPIVRRAEQVAPLVDCAHAACDRKAYSSGYCRPHYRRSLEGRDMDAPLRVTKRPVEPPTCCSHPDCGKPHKAHGFCSRHYDQACRDGSIPNRRPCAIALCDRYVSARGLCSGHYQRVHMRGEPIEAQGRLRAVPGSGHTARNGYRYVRGPNGRPVGEHRLVWEQHNGPLLPGEEVHHRNSQRADNSIENLELWIKSQPAGSRVSDMIPHWVEMLGRYAPEMLAESARPRP